MRALTAATLAALLVSACGGAAAPPPATAAKTEPARTATAAAATAAPSTAATGDARPLYVRAELTDVRTAERFTIGGSPGKVTLVLAMAVW